MTYDYELVLIRQSFAKDDIGNQIPDESKDTVLCGVKSTIRSEFYSAATAGLKPERVFVVHGYEYNGEKIVEFDGVRYNVIRTYAVGFEETELICEKVMSYI